MRQCNECTACCEGSLNTQVFEHEIYPGKPCHFLTAKGCGIYDKRPYEPCQRYKCAWLLDDGTKFPEWMRPDRAKAIPSMLSYIDADGSKKPCIRVSEHKGKLDSAILNWYFKFALENNFPLAVQVEGWWSYYGPQEFIDAIQNTTAESFVKYDKQ